MIAPMKRLTVLCLAADRDRTLEELRELGVLHPVPAHPPAGADLDADRAAHEKVHAAMQLLEAVAPRTRAGGAPARTAEDILALAARRRDASETLARLREERDAVAPLGEFDPAAVRALAEGGVRLRIYRMPARHAAAAVDNGLGLVLGRDAGGTYIAMVTRDEEPGIDAPEVPLPARALSVVTADIREAEARLEALDGELRAAAAALPALARQAQALEETIAFHEARAGMGEAETIAYISGFCPADALDDIRGAAHRHGWGFAADDPTPEEPVPTLVRNPPWIRPIRFMFELIGIVPGYREADISAAFLAFFSVFFAMVVSDAGYGLLFLAATIGIRLAAPRAPRDLTRLLGVLSICTIAWGALTGNYFGLQQLPAPLAGLRVDWLSDEKNLMGFCFLLGAIHLTLAHIWNSLRMLNSTMVFAQLGWIAMTWTMYFAARLMILDYPMPSFVTWMFLAGLAAIALFMTPLKAMKHEWHNHIMLPLSIINNFGDVVSYVRLFAVGSASTAIAVAFNELAVGGGISSFWAGLGAACILFAAHTLNILLCALGVIVHGVRLNTLEFCGHMGIQWTGFPYRPFARGTRRD